MFFLTPLHLTVKSHTHTLSVVGHVSGGGAELGIGLDDLVNGLQEVFLCGDLPPSSDGKHARLCAHAADLGAWQEITHESNSAHRTSFWAEQEMLGMSLCRPFSFWVKCFCGYTDTNLSFC